MKETITIPEGVREIGISKFEDKVIIEFIPEKKEVCERCEKDCNEVFECERCGQMICDKCQAVYNQYSQIDYNCCKSCANAMTDNY